MLIIKGQPVPKKNSQEIRYKRVNGRKVPFIAQGKRYEAYEEGAVWQLSVQREKLPPPPYNVKCVYYRQNKIRCDLVNLIEGTNDILVKAGIIFDDNFLIVATHDGSRVLIDVENPRVEITITHQEE